MQGITRNVRWKKIRKHSERYFAVVLYSTYWEQGGKIKQIKKISLKEICTISYLNYPTTEGYLDIYFGLDRDSDYTPVKGSKNSPYVTTWATQSLGPGI